ncbi:MAG TPA: amidohydrolase family protein [Bryobacteraceae bacterium]|nr:amidohydrolase family protein [Bryobacteraceae bacterium]
MSKLSRRTLFTAAGLGLAAAPLADAQEAPAPAARRHLDLSDYEPRSMLQVKETHVDRARFPVIDMHAHLTRSKRIVNGVGISPDRDFDGGPDDVLPMMEAKNIRALVNLTGGYESGLVETVRRFDKAHPGRFFTFCEPSYSRLLEPGYPKLQAQNIADAHAAGARGLKILKTLGLFLRDNITTGKLITVDDPRFDPMWDACGQLGIPVAMHVSDPVAFFLPIDRFNERFEELNAHPDWSYYDHDFPSNAEILAARNRVIARHPKTQFLTLHVGNFSENLANVSENLDRFPNMTVEIAARVAELGRQPRTTGKFFDRYQDRIMFGTDGSPGGDNEYWTKLYEISYRFLETDDEYFTYSSARVPGQGRWNIYGLGLPDQILRKVYNENALRLLNEPA